MKQIYKYLFAAGFACCVATCLGVLSSDQST